MSRRCIRWLFAGLLVLASAISAYATEVSPSPELIRIPGHKLSALAKATALPSMRQNERQPITLTIVLKRDRQAEFERYLKDLYDPHSKVFHKFLTQSEIAGRFGPSQQGLQSNHAIHARERLRTRARIRKSADFDDAWHARERRAFVPASVSRVPHERPEVFRQRCQPRDAGAVGRAHPDGCGTLKPGQASSERRSD